jgi:hypothetical protein
MDRQIAQGGGPVLKDLLVTLALLLIFLASLEAGLRFFGLKNDASLYRLDRDLGYVLRPNAAGWSVKERERYERINSAGMRDREHSRARPPGVIRIAVVGDSFAEAKQVDADAAYWSNLERELNRRLAPRRFEVLNFGVAGYGIAQEYGVIERRIWDYDPQIVLLTGTLHSLILKSSRHFSASIPSEGPVPFYELRDGRLELDAISRRERAAFVPPSAWDDRVADLTNASRLLSLLNAARRRVSSLTLKQAASALVHTSHAGPIGAEQANDEAHALENLAMRGPATPDLAQAFAVCEALIERARDTVEQHHAEFWFVLLDMAPQIDPDDAHRARTAAALAVPDLWVGERALADFARRAGIAHVFLAPAMLRHAQEHQTVLHGFPHHPRNTGHWNELGHALAGELIAHALESCSPTLTGQSRGALTESSQCHDDAVLTNSAEPSTS